MTGPSRPFIALLLLATGLLLYVAFPFRTPLFLAVVIAAVLHDPLERLTVALRGHRTIASALMTLAVLVLIVAPFAALVGFVTRESVTGLAYLRETLGVTSVSELRGAELPARLSRMLDLLHLSREQVFDAAAKLVEIVQAAVRLGLATVTPRPFVAEELDVAVLRVAVVFHMAGFDGVDLQCNVAAIDTALRKCPAGKPQAHARSCGDPGCAAKRGCAQR